MIEIGSIVGQKYKVLNKIGQGGMSIVYLAMNEKANKQWAIKEIRKKGTKDFDVVKQGLMSEVEMLKKFNHPYLPSIVDVIDNEEGTFLIVMDYIEGKPLSDALNEYGAQSQENVILWAKQLCDVLSYLHSQKPPIIYRDMKPANIMLKPNGNITLIDFGTAREYKKQNIADTTCLGTRGYAAPEQFGGQGQTDARTDIYTLGSTLHHLITGRNPCEPPYELNPIREINSNLSSGLERIISKCVQKNPELRYQNCEELMYDLEHYNEIDDLYIKKQKRKLISFIVASALSIILFISSIICFLVSSRVKLEDYNHMVDTGRYLDAIDIAPSRKEAYIALIRKNKLDSDFSDSEANVIRKLENNKAIDGLKKDSESYAEVCYQIATAYWFYNDSDQATKSEATKWFSNVVSVPEKELSEMRKRDKKLALVFQQIGTFYNDEITWNKEGGVQSKAYTNYWNNLNTLLDEEEFENEFVIIKIMNEIIKESLQRQKNLNNDGICNADIASMISNVQDKLKKINFRNEQLTIEKANLMKLCDMQLKLLEN